MAIRELNSRIGHGEVLGLIGPNGSGKTTFLNLITGIYRPTSVDILFEGENVVGGPPFQMVRKGVARTFQNIELFQGMTVLDNISLGHTFTCEQDFWPAACTGGKPLKKRRD